MNTEQILKAATPRPWKLDAKVSAGQDVKQGGFYGFRELAATTGMFWIARIQAFTKELIPCAHSAADEHTANAELILLAVNGYEAREALIADLVTALEFAVKRGANYHDNECHVFLDPDDLEDMPEGTTTNCNCPRGVIRAALAAAKKVQP